MLKFKKITLMAALGAAMGFSSMANADVNETLANICTIVEADDKGELRKKMRTVNSDYRLKLRDYYSGITCGGQSLIKSSFNNNSIETGTLLIKKMPREALTAPEHDNQGTLLEWATANANSPELLKELKARIE